MDRKFQIFISSTYEDLKEERDEAFKAVLSLHHFPIGMEMFNADDNNQWDVIKQSIESSDFYVLIIGYRYGSLTKRGRKISYTQKEYEYAKSIKKPILAFIKYDNIPTQPAFIETKAPMSKKLELFKEDVKEGAVVKFWTNKNDLAQIVTSSLALKFAQKMDGGWVKADYLPSIDVTNEITRLSRENNELRKELSDLSRKVSSRKPQLVVELLGMNNNQFIGGEFNVPDTLFFLRPIEKTEYGNYINKGYSLELIERSNDNLKIFNSQLTEFSNSTFWRECIKVKHPFKIRVHNTGNLKANSIIVKMEVEEGLLIGSPQNRPSIKVVKYDESIFNIRLEENFEKLEYSYLFRDSYVQRNSLFSKMSLPKHKISNNYKKLEFEISNLLHKNSFDLDFGLYFNCIVEGNKNVKISLICEELADECLYSFNLNFIMNLQKIEQ